MNSNMPGYGYGVSIANACTDTTVKDNNIQFRVIFSIYCIIFGTKVYLVVLK